MTIALGKTPIIIRQTCSVAFAGLAPMGPTSVTPPVPAPIPYIPARITYSGGLSGGGVKYVSPAEETIDALTQGGLFTFNEAVYIKEIRGICGGAATMTISVCEADDSGTVVVSTAVPAVSDREVYTDLVLLKGQKLKISTSVAGRVDVYAVKADA